jgi:hypothetical protein
MQTSFAEEVFMAKKSKRLVSKKTRKKLMAAAPWALAALATGGMLAAFADRGIRARVKTLTASTVEKIRPQKRDSSQTNGMVNGIVPQESGAV